MPQKAAIFLRRSASINRFRSVLGGCLTAPSLTEAIVASGFFQERANFAASKLFNLGRGAHCQPLTLTFVGVYNGHWVPQFNDFVSSVRASNHTGGVTVTKRRAKGLRWHAKTFIGSVRGVPRVGIIGSSNMTRPAADTTAPFNYEADVVLWYEADAEINSVMSTQLANIDGDHGVIVTTYDQGGANGALSLGDRLKVLRDEILNTSTES